MSALAAVSRTRASIQPLNASRSAGSSIVQLQQRRGYAAVKKGKSSKQGTQSFRGGKDDGQGQLTQAKREKKLGAFRPMPSSQLTHKIFESDRLNELRLPPFQPETLTESNAGKAMVLSISDNDPARIFGFRVLSKPATLVRNVTLRVVDKLQAASQQSSENNRLIFYGSSGCGKSFLLLQGVQYAKSMNWIVLYIPRAINLVNSTSTYTYDLRTQTYLQPVFAYQTLQRFLTVNSTALQSLTTDREIGIENRAPVPAGTSLKDLIEIGLKDQMMAPTVLAELLEVLGRQTEFPVLLAIDDFQALYCKSSYRDPHYAAIKSWHLSMPRLLLEYASGKKTFFIGALSMTNTTFKLSTELRYALKLQSWMHPSPYLKTAPEVEEFTKGIKTLKVPDQLSMGEAASLFEVWMKDFALLEKGSNIRSTDELFLSKYTESGGNARDFVWKGLLSTLEIPLLSEKETQRLQ
ncbi:hypothetical protein EW146_g3049 [Bondarzewia mesenterica]|uniref:Small ribosomal subunit protein mS29 n=1 Tax=Bondarzewia mesenterica TaxID=1095465 RepID=A0A4S4LYP9_9AGAM|nr:hypothetical protein EW146_g3049 [Bondarzewia mesenterica]